MRYISPAPVFIYRVFLKEIMSIELTKNYTSGNLSQKATAVYEPLTPDELETIRLSVEEGILKGNTSLAIRALRRLLELETQRVRVSDQAA